MIARTQESFKSLTSDEVRKLHTSLGLVATAKFRTCRDYEARILRSQPQKIEEPIAPQPIALQTIAPESIAPQPAEEDDPPNRGDNGRGRLRPENNSFAALIAPVETELVRSVHDLDFLYQQEMESQLAVERTEIGSIGEKIVYKHLRNVEEEISKLKNRIQALTTPVLPKIWDKATSDVAIGDYIRIPFHPIWIVADKEEMSDGRTRLLVRTSTGNHSEEWYLPAPQPVQSIWSLDEIEEAIAQLKSDILTPNKLNDRPVRTTASDTQTIAWKTPFEGEILGRRKKIYPFFVEGDYIYIIFRSGADDAYCASEHKRKNDHHVVIRQAVEAGKTFDISIPTGERCRFGRIHQSCDGWWWAWPDGQATGHKFLTRLMALKHLELRNAELGNRVTSAARG